MSNQTQTVEVSRLVITTTNWLPLREAFNQFIEAHPELGLKASTNTFRNFSRIHGPSLLEQDVMRKPLGLRSPAIVDGNRFDAAAFELISKRGYSPDLNDTEVA